MLRIPIAALVAGALLVGAAPAHAHGTVPEPGVLAPAAPGSAEARLRQIETQALGAEHATAHAFQRQLAALARRQGLPHAARTDAAARAAQAAAPRQAGDDGGTWEAPSPLKVIAINSILLPTGKVLMFAYPGRPFDPTDPDYPNSTYANLSHAYVWDPVAKTSKLVDPPLDPATGDPTNLWCGGASLLADGRVLITGGNVGDPLTEFHGIDIAFTFDPFTETWQRQQPMRQGRWYPTQVLMPDGRTAIVGGLTKPGDPDYGPGPVVGEPGGVDNDLEFFSPDGTMQRDGLRFNSANGPPMYPLYPRLLWMPSGRIFSAGPYVTDTWFLKPAAPGGTSTWSEAADLSRQREFGNVVQLPGGRVLTLGGSPEPDAANADRRPATGTSEEFDENSPSAGWHPSSSMAVARSHANSVVLPDGTIATIGGGYGDDPTKYYYRWQYTDTQKRVELRDPATGAVKLGAPQREGRTYHSTALLLPDGRVMSAGDDINGEPDGAHPDGAGTGITDDTAEIYSPPYLFKKDGATPGNLAPRPQIVSVPATVNAGDRFEVQTSGPAATRAVIVAPGASTHAFDMSQRRVELGAPEAAGAGRIALRMPGDVNVAPPGYYMLFLLSADGVPSVARFVKLNPPGPAPPPPPPPSPAPPPPPPVEPPPPPPPPAEVKPKLNVTGALPSLRTIRRTRRFSVMVGISEPGTVVLGALLDRGSKPGLAIAGRRTTVFKAAGKRRVTFTLTRAGLRRLADLRRGVVRIRTVAKLTSQRTLPVLQTRRRLR